MADILLDAGHGDPDPGAVGIGGVREADVVREFVDLLGCALDCLGHSVVESRPKTSFVSLADRVKKAHEHGVDLFYSVHCNAFDLPSANGMEVFTSHGVTNSDLLVDFVYAELYDAELPQRWRYGANRSKDKEANFYVLNRTRMPAALHELGFITNPKEVRLLTDHCYLQKVANSVAVGIDKYFEHV